MDNLLSKLNQLTDEEWKQIKQEKDKKKPSVQFSSATIRDCTRGDGLNLDLKNIVNNQTAPTLHLPKDLIPPVPSDFLCQTLERINLAWVINNEKAARIVIDAILTEVLLHESNEKLSGYCEVKNDWDGVGFGYTGNVDYMFGSSTDKTVQDLDSFLLIVEAKKEWPDSAVPQVIAEAGCLLKKRLAAGKVFK